jgi:hypothetical protein
VVDKGKEGRWCSGGVVEAEGGSRPLYRNQKWGARVPPVVVVANETTPLIA